MVRWGVYLQRYYKFHFKQYSSQGQLGVQYGMNYMNGKQAIVFIMAIGYLKNTPQIHKWAWSEMSQEFDRCSADNLEIPEMGIWVTVRN